MYLFEYYDHCKRPYFDQKLKMAFVCSASDWRTAQVDVNGGRGVRSQGLGHVYQTPRKGKLYVMQGTLRFYIFLYFLFLLQFLYFLNNSGDLNVSAILWRGCDHSVRPTIP